MQEATTRLVDLKVRAGGLVTGPITIATESQVKKEYPSQGLKTWF